MSFINKLNTITERYEQVSNKLMQPEVAASPEFATLSKEFSDLEPIVKLAYEYIKTSDAQEEIEELLKSPDDDMREMAEQEKVDNDKRLEEFKNELKILLLPKDEADEKSAIIEIRAGTGGDEAALFASVLFRMYRKYAEKHGWKFEILSATKTGLEGYKEASANIIGKGVFARLKFESGVHRVQRIPETESSGRIHTSAATVAILPEAEEVDIKIDDRDIKIDVFRASGAGGQHVNTTDSAVRITHLPTGIVVSQQDEKSQHKNKAKAMKILRARIYDTERQKKDTERSAMRKGMVGSGDRSERIRTYNYPQSRITDHRINMTLYSLANVVNEGELDELVNALIAEDQAAKLMETKA